MQLLRRLSEKIRVKRCLIATSQDRMHVMLAVQRQMYKEPILQAQELEYTTKAPQTRFRRDKDFVSNPTEPLPFMVTQAQAIAETPRMQIAQALEATWAQMVQFSLLLHFE